MALRISSSEFPGFERLSANIWCLDAPNSAGQTRSTPKNAPDLIILSTWMDASARHINKYILGYQTVYPHSKLLVITNTVADVTFRTERTQMTRLEPVLSIIQTTQAAAPNHKSRVLLHIFSNGGANQACTLAKMHQKHHNTPLPVKAMVLDSCPGTPTFRTAIAAFSVALPPFWPLRVVLLGIIYLLLGLSMILHQVVPSQNMLMRMRERLNDTAFFPLDAPRVYIYSKSDDMIDWEDVELHAADARKQGWKADLELFDGSKHVGHLVADSNKFWKAVQSVGDI
jgi:Eukaryotic protein of unknown function (DUF829)